MKRMVLATRAFIILGVLFYSSLCNADVLQSQPSSDGFFEVSLNSVKIRGEVLTVRMTLKNISGKSVKLQLYYQSVYYTDIQNKKKYFALKDSEGKYIAGPKDRNSEGGKIERYLKAEQQTIMWIKFPAPPVTTKTVDIIIPDVLPFEEVQIKR